MKQAFIFSTKVWLTTIIIGPLIMGIRTFFMYDWVDDRWANAFFVPKVGIPAGLVFFLPSFVLLSLFSWYLNKKVIFINIRKLYLSLVAVVLAIIPFAVINYRSLFTINTGLLEGFPPDLFWTCTYVSLTLAGVWFYKLKPVTDEPI
jgi:hypothetical protein